MRFLTIFFVVFMLISTSIALSEGSFLSESGLPLLKRDLSSDPQKFTFAIIGDKTGDGEKNWPIFDRAIEEINLLNPDFAITIGDHVQGYTTDLSDIKAMWDKFLEHLSKLKVPIFLIPGNHDITNTVMYNYWKENIGKTYYSFDYKGCHFLVLSSEEHRAPEGPKSANKALIDFAVEDIEKNKHAKHIFVFVHRPIWLEDEEVWQPIEFALKGTNHTVFAGHYHELVYERRSDHNYIVLGATGGVLNEFPDPKLGLFHHFSIVSVDGDDVSVAIIKPGNILPQNVSTKEFQDNLWASSFRLKSEMPIPLGGETVNGKLTMILDNRVDKPLLLKVQVTDIDEALWKIDPKELVIEAGPGEEKGITVELSYNADSILNPPKCAMEFHYDGMRLAKWEQQIEFMPRAGFMTTPLMRTIDKWMTVFISDVPDAEGKDSDSAESIVYDYFQTLVPQTDKIGAVSEAKKGELDLDLIYDAKDYAIACAWAYIYSPTDITVWGALTADDIASVFINDAQVSRTYRLSKSKWQYEFFPVSLRSGWNRVLVKCADVSGDWCFTFGLDDPTGQLKFSPKI